MIWASGTHGFKQESLAVMIEHKWVRDTRKKIKLSKAYLKIKNINIIHGGGILECEYPVIGSDTIKYGGNSYNGFEVRTDALYVHSNSKSMSWSLSFSSNLNSDTHVNNKQTNAKNPKPKERKKSTPHPRRPPQTF